MYVNQQEKRGVPFRILLLDCKLGVLLHKVWEIVW